MGLSKDAVRFILKAHKQEPFIGPVLLLGRQHVFVTMDELREIASALNLPLTSTDEVNDPQTDIPDWQVGRAQGYISDTALFLSLGATSVVHMDISDYEKAELVHDLNSPIDHSLRGTFATVVDGGTLEHVFDIRAAMQNVVSLLKVGGQVVHITQASNWIDHGFYQFSPVFFYDYYSTNGCRVAKCFLAEQGVEKISRSRWRWHPWSARGQKVLLAPGHVGICVVARKESDVPPRVPQQSTLSEDRSDSSDGSSAVAFARAWVPHQVLHQCRRLYWRLKAQAEP